MKTCFPIWIALAVLVGCETRPPLPPPQSPLQSGARSERPGQNAEPEYPDSWRGSKTVTVARGVHVLGRLFPSAAFAIETSAGVVLIDAGAAEDIAPLRESLWEVGLKASRVRYLLLTHAHYDHVFGANRLRALSGATVCAGKQDCEVLREPNLDALFSLFPRGAYSGAPITVDRELVDGDVIELGDTRIEVLSTPGHTPGSTCFLLRRDDQRILFSGDVIASLNFGPATYPVRLSPQYRGNAEAYARTLDRLLKMEPPDLLLTGHPRQQRQLHSIRIDERRWRQLLEPAQQELNEILARHQRDGEDFLDDTAKQIEADFWYLGRYEGVGVYWFRWRGERFLVNAPGGTDLPAFLADRLQRLGIDDRTANYVLLTEADEKAWSGLNALVPRPRVVAHPEWIEVLRSRGIEELITPEEFSQLHQEAITPITLSHSLAYAVTRDSRRILLSPDVPRNLTLVWRNRFTGGSTRSALQPQSDELFRSLAADRNRAMDYRNDLEQLRDTAPHVWLPAIPRSGQNANLYDDDWQLIVDENARQIPSVQGMMPRD